jgi:hypothetical protein
VAERARAKLRGENVDEAQRSQDRDKDTIQRWADGEGVDLEGRAEEAKQKLRNVDRARE